MAASHGTGHRGSETVVGMDRRKWGTRPVQPLPPVPMPAPPVVVPPAATLPSQPPKVEVQPAAADDDSPARVQSAAPPVPIVAPVPPVTWEIVGFYGAVDDGGTFVRTVEQAPVK